MGQVVWGGRTFSTQAQLAAWLRQRGVSYQQWAQNHPAAAAKLENRAPVAGGDAAPQGPGGIAPGDYQGMIQNEPVAQYDLGQLTAGTQSAAADRAAAAQGLIAQYGAVPQGYQDPYGDLAGLGGLPQENPYSTLAQIGRNAGFQRADMTAERAARGVLSSGGTTLAEKNLGYNRGLQEYTALNELMGRLGGINKDFASTAAQNVNAQPGIYNDAMQRLLAAGINPAGGKLGGPGGPGGGPVPGMSLAELLKKYGAPKAYRPGQVNGPGIYSSFGNSINPNPTAPGRASPTVNEAAQQEKMRRTYGPSRPGDPDWGNMVSLGTVTNNAAGAKKYPGLFGK